MISFQEAQQIIAAKARFFGSELISLADADGRVLAEDIHADRDYPPFNRAAMDGYAINLQDYLKGTREFELKTTVFAGETPQRELRRGECYKIMTGAAVPPSANCVVRKEDSQQQENRVRFTIEQLKEFQNIAKQGEDLKQGDLAIKANSICNPAMIGTLASLGKSEIRVHKLPEIALFTTGNEIQAVDVPVSAVQIRNSNEWFLRSALKKWQIRPQIIQHIPDDVEALKANISRALSKDIIIMSGGVSAGDADYVPSVLEELGVKKLFHKVAIKPGKPIWCGELQEGGLVFALPGNPFSCLVNFKLFIETYLSVCFGTGFIEPESLHFDGSRRKKSNLDEFFPVQASGSPLSLKPLEINGSGDIRLGLQANAIALQPADSSELEPGTIVSYYRL